MTPCKALKAGDTIGIAAPASPFDRAKFMKGAHAIERMGFKTFYCNDIFDQTRYLAGTDERRAREFTELIRRESIAAIMFARGGYGSQRIIPLLNAGDLSGHPKPVIGFSDVTALLTFLRQSCSFPTFYGPVITQLGSAKSRLTQEALLHALTSRRPLGEMPVGNSKVLKAGRSEGLLVGGCLSLINSSMGTPYELETRDCILFIEEVNEKVYVIDRMLTQLKNSGKLGSVRGIVFGSLVPPLNESYDIECMIRDVMRDFGGPIIMDFPAGHTEDFVTLPLGAEVVLEANEGTAPRLTYITGILS